MSTYSFWAVASLVTLSYGQAFLRIPSPEEHPTLFYCCYGSLETVSNHITAQNVNSLETDDGIKPIHLAILYNQFPIAKYLIDLGCEVDCADSTLKNTPLIFAALKGNTNIIDCLLSKNADLEAKNVFYETALSASVKGEWYVTAMNSPSQRPITVRAILVYPSEDAAGLLIRRGANVDAKNAGNVTPLMSASKNGLLKTLALLVEKNADVDARDCNGYTAFHYAAIYGQIPVLQWLKEKCRTIDPKKAIYNDVISIIEQDRIPMKIDHAYVQFEKVLHKPRNSEEMVRVLKLMGFD